MADGRHCGVKGLVVTIINEVEEIGGGHQWEPLAQIALATDDYTFGRLRSSTSGPWHYRLCLEPDGVQDGCDVEELPAQVAADILAKLCGVYVYE